MKGYIVVEFINQVVILHYTKKFDDALEFVKIKSAEFKTDGGDISCLNLEDGRAWGETEYGYFWSLEVQAMEDIDII